MDYISEIALMNRRILLSFLENLSLEQLNKVPNGFNNNIFWNIAHVVVTQQLLVYNLSGLPMMIDDNMVAKYRKGSKAEENATEGDVERVKKLLFSTIERTREDYSNGLFKKYNAYTTSTNATISSVEEAMTFNTFHEGTHLGYILALKRAL